MKVVLKLAWFGLVTLTKIEHVGYTAPRLDVVIQVFRESLYCVPVTEIDDGGQQQDHSQRYTATHYHGILVTSCKRHYTF